MTQAEKKILDWSNYTGIPTAAEIAELKADGWDGCILGTQNDSVTRQQYAACVANSFPVEALYTFVYWWDVAADLERLRLALVMANEWDLKVWLDCEWITTNNHLLGWADTPMPSPAAIVALIHQYVDYLGQRVAGIYTGRWWWVPYTNDSHDFAYLLLWYADYQHAAVVLAAFVAFGGWLKAHIWQYSSDGVLGLTADLDVEESPEEDDEMMKRFNTLSPRLAGAAVASRDNVGLDWFADALPAGAKMLRLEAYLNNGALRIFDGNGAYAGQVGWGGVDADTGIVDVNVESGYFQVEGPASLAQLGVVGWW